MVGALILGSMAFGAASGIGSYWSNYWDTKDALNQQKDNLKEQWAADINTINLEYDTAKETANKNADTEDTRSTLYESIYGDSMNSVVNQLSQQQKAETESFNNSAMQIGASEGDALSTLASSGTRAGSSVSQAVDMKVDNAQQSLQTSENNQRSQDKYSLEQSLNSLAGNLNTLQEARTDASDLRGSYEEGGSQYKLYQNTLSNTDLKYNQAIDSINDQLDDMNNPWKNILNTVTSMFGGASSGLQMGAAVSGYVNDSMGLESAGKSASNIEFLGSQGNAFDSFLQNNSNSLYLQNNNIFSNLDYAFKLNV